MKLCDIYFLVILLFPATSSSEEVGLVIPVIAQHCTPSVQVERGDFNCYRSFGSWAPQELDIVAVRTCSWAGLENEAVCCIYSDAVGVTPGPVVTKVGELVRKDCFPDGTILDTVRVEVADIGSVIFVDGFESGDTSRWR